MINYKKILNKEQFEAANIVDGPGLIIAGAGSGKTATVTYRAARLIEKGINPENILLITFTNKAANEMKTRICNILGPDGQKVTAQTFHSFCANVLRKYAGTIGIEQNYTILDSEDSKTIIEEVCESLVHQKNELPKSNVFLSMLTFINNCNKSLKEAVDLFAEDYMDDIYKIDQVLKGYIKYKEAHNYLDYDDLLVKTNELFETHSNISKKLATQYKYIMVDEYQDVNQTQLSLLKNMIKDTHNNIVVVGDDQQSIYAFRGANFKNIINFQKDFPGAKLVILNKNYRSTQGILNVANAIVEEAKEKYPKTLVAMNDDNQRPMIIKTQDQEGEYTKIISEIQRLIRFGATYDDIAILTRTANTTAFEMELTKQKLKYKKYGGMKLFAKAHMKDVVCYLKVLSNYQDELAWKRVLKMIDGIGTKTADKIIEEVLKYDIKGLLTFKKRKFGENIEDLYNFLECMRQKKTVEEIIAALIEEYDNTNGYYTPYLMITYPKDYKKRMEELKSLLVSSYNYNNVTKFLEDVVLDGTPEVEEDGVLTLSTIHSAKGLEFEYVFILDCTDGNFPSFRAKTEDEIEEERRIFYVAVTRAKKELFICVPREMCVYGHFTEPKISRFLTKQIQNDYLGTLNKNPRYFNAEMNCS